MDARVNIAHAYFNFQEYSDEKERIDDTINLVSKIMQNSIEIHTYYKSNKVVIIQPYFVNKNGKKEPFQRSYHSILALFNPFLIVRKEIEIGSFSY